MALTSGARSEAFLAILEARGLSTAKISLLRCLRLLHSFSTSRGEQRATPFSYVTEREDPGDLTSSCRLASEYARIGQHSKAAAIFSQASQDLDRLEPAEVAIELHIRHALFQAMLGQTAERYVLWRATQAALIRMYTDMISIVGVCSVMSHISRHWTASPGIQGR